MRRAGDGRSPRRRGHRHGPVRALEVEFWNADRGFDEARLADGAVVILTDPVRGPDREQITPSICDPPRRTILRKTGRNQVEIGADGRLRSCTASAERAASGEEYGAVIVGVSLRRDGAWKLAFYQQGPRVARG